MQNACLSICLIPCLKVSEQFLLRRITGLRLHAADRHTSYTYALTRTDLQTGRSARGYLKKGRGSSQLCVCVFPGVLINCTDVDFCVKSTFCLIISTSNTPHWPHPKPITGTHRRMRGGGESQSVRVVWINPSLHTRPLLPLSIFLFEIHSDLKPDVRDKV